MPSLLNDLNPIQQQAVKSTDGPNLVLAGAGSGKTRVLTYKVAHLIADKKISADQIMVVTFTNKASGEMRDRILKLLNPNAKHQALLIPLMGTFHSISSKILRKDGYLLGLKPGFSIYDEGDALDAIKEAMSNLNIPTQKFSPTSIRYTISGAKNELISELEYPQYANGFFQETAAKVYLEYQKILRRNQALDFDDLLLSVNQLFRSQPEILSRYQQQFKYLLVDEYQDTNAAQYQLIKQLAKRYRNICAVGDASQAIYGFRGADFRNIVNFQKDYPETKVFNLEQNYRSTQTILDAAHFVISENKGHPILKLWTDKKSGPKITLFQAGNEVEEAHFVLEEIRKQARGGGSGGPPPSTRNEMRMSDGGNSRQDPEPVKLSDFAILYRTNAQSRSLEEVFLKSGLPYKLVGGVQFYERKEIKDVLSYLKLASNPVDSVAKKRIEKIGKIRAGRFYQLLEELQIKFSDPDKYPQTIDLMDTILTRTGYLEYLEDGTEQGKMRIENVKELRSVAEEFPNLGQFLENVALIQDNQMPDGKTKLINQDAVTLMTIHASKGLEYPIVFLVGMEEGLFPHSRSMLDPNQMEEERRLAYVGITRAKDKLYMTYTRSRLYFGTRSNAIVSRFLGSIPESLIDSKTPFRDTDKYLSRSYTPKNDFNDDVYSTGLKDDDDWLNS